MSSDDTALNAYWDWVHTIRDWPRGAALPIVQSVLEQVSTNDRVLYIGVGDGRNFLTLVEAGVDVIGCDVSGVAIDRLVSIDSRFKDRLIRGHFRDLATQGSGFDTVVASRVLVRPDLGATAADLDVVHDMLRPDGLFVAEWTASGTDPWPGWELADLDYLGNLRLLYPAERVQKLYLSFLGCVNLLEEAHFEVARGPIAVDLPRQAYPGGIVRDWLVSARSAPR